ncbi:MAG: ribonuclease protein component [Verrucomicrobiales bacterium]|nr:ribonuclease protein component [Verrucomicrobiales bacterium]
MALPSEFRLTRTRDFAAIREQGKSWTSRCLILAIRPRPDSTHAHAGFTTTKRIGNAVTRNLVRRRLRMIVRQSFPRISVTHDIVTIAKYPAVKAGFAELEAEWEKLAIRAGLFQGAGLPTETKSVGKSGAPSGDGSKTGIETGPSNGIGNAAGI